MREIALSYHQCLHFRSGREVCTIGGSQAEARICFIKELKLKASPEIVHSITEEITIYRPESLKTKKELVEMIQLDHYSPEKVVGVGSQLDLSIHCKIEAFLKENIATFVWAIVDMIGIDSSITSHELNVDPSYKPIRQKHQKLSTERAQAVNEEVKKLLKVGSIQEVKYPEWLENPVVVKKKNGKWRVCVDFTDKNKVYPKDCFPLPHIDQLVEATARNELVSFMDASP
ncbi:hypothetical protein V5N11_033129 [Cardamine amara subsp. amara]|uniref:Gag-pol polyprotein n=1 Tax=Cardamine amara subsp. amara TaxID=228776 RepID=A0ABD1BLS0_CARAN